MVSSIKRLFALLLIAMTTTAPLTAQTNEMVNLIHSFQAAARSGKPVSLSQDLERANPIVERLGLSDDKVINETLPAILEAAADPDVSVRRLAALALFAIARPDRHILMRRETTTFAALLVDPDIGIRKLTGFTLTNSWLDSASPLLQNLQAYLYREDAVATIGAGVAGLIMRAAPDDAVSTTAVVHFMQRKDQTSASQADLLQSVSVARSHNRDIGREVANYANDSNERTSVLAIQTLQTMGSEVVLDNQQLLLRIAADPSRSAAMRDAAAKILSRSTSPALDH